MHHQTLPPLSFGTVQDESPVEFDPERGPVVNVSLQPSRIPVRCRVLMLLGGAGEGEGHPFVAGDEVLVAVPGGDPRGECVILGRLPNKVDAYPTTAGGQDTTKNAVSFRRGAVPRVEEYKGLWSVSSQPSGAFVSVSGEGTVTLRDGSKGALQMSADALSYVSGDAEHYVQLDLGSGQFTVKTGSATLALGQGGSGVLAPGSLAISAGGQPAAEHVATTESVLNLLCYFITAVGAANPGPLSGAGLAAALATVLPGSIAAAAVGPLLPPVAAALFAAFAASVQKGPGVPGQGQLTPGVGCSSFLAG